MNKKRAPTEADPGHNQKDTLVLAAHDLTPTNPQGFTIEQLTVAAFKRCNNQFGLEGFKDKYPDHNKVKAALYGKKGLQIRDRFLQKVKASLFGLTAEGRARVCELLGQAVTKERAPESTIALTPEEKTLLECLTSKRLKRKIHEGTIDDWTFDDACRIWGLDGSHVGNTIDRFLGYTKQTIQSLQNKTTGSYEPIRFGSTSIPVASLQTYAKLLDSLETKFAVHLTLMRRRKKKVIA